MTYKFTAQITTVKRLYLSSIRHWGNTRVRHELPGIKGPVIKLWIKLIRSTGLKKSTAATAFFNRIALSNCPLSVSSARRWLMNVLNISFSFSYLQSSIQP